MANVKPISPHGTTGRYTNHGCRCHECRAAQAAYAKAWREANRERIAGVSKAWRDANTERRRQQRRDSYLANREVRLAENREWARLNPAANARRAAEWRKRNPAARAAAVATWRAKNPEAVRLTARSWIERNRPLTVIYSAQRRARRLAADTRTVTARDWNRLISRHHGKCAYCGSTSDRLTQDHIVPLIRGGRHAIGNLLPACQSCNSSKATKLLVVWRRPANHPTERRDAG